EPAERVSLTLNGPFAGALESEGDDNLVLRAARALQDWASSQQRKIDGARLTLRKNLPIASGIGGGSSDAAATLTLLNRLWRLHIGPRPPRRRGPSPGGVFPFGRRARPILGEGGGDGFPPCPTLPNLPAFLSTPGVPGAPASVFGAFIDPTGSTAPPLER